jgi:lactate racemase
MKPHECDAGGYTGNPLTEAEVSQTVQRTLSSLDLAGRRVLLIIPDSTRSAPVGLFYREIYRFLEDTALSIDVLVALGTHQSMSREQIFRRLEISAGEYQTRFSEKTQLYNHQWDNPDALQEIGRLSADEVAGITEGLIREPVRITINRMIFSYDQLIVIGPVFPHEIVGFSGGNKYFFPGICGEDILNLFHWIGALVTNAVINGVIDTPVRKIIDRAADFITVPRTFFHLVVRHGVLLGIYPGSAEDAWREAARCSSHVNIVTTGRRYSTVLGIAPLKYDELWTAGKVAYKAETVVEDGGRLIVYAPHITELSRTHDAFIRRGGYHVLDYFLENEGHAAGVPGSVLSHLIAVKGSGTCRSGEERPRIRVVLATGIPEETCRAVNLEYMNPDEINPDAWKGREQEGILVIEDAGEVLYKVGMR